LRRTVSLFGIGKDTYARNSPDFTLHEFGELRRLAFRGNPAILEALWNPDLVVCDPWGHELRAMRNRFLHRGSLKVYVAYAEGQLQRRAAGKPLHAKGGVYSAKYGAHLVRLLHAGIALATSQEVSVRVPEPLGAELLRIRRREVPIDEVIKRARALLEELKRLSGASALPERPDIAAVDDLVARARLSRA
jgi:hypothetical protein